MPEDSLGSGLYLDQTLDFDINTTGDLRSSSGSAELEKDLSFQLLIILDGVKGQPLTPALRADVKDLTTNTLLSDSRVQSVDQGSMQVSKPNPEAIRINAVVTALGTEQELVFRV
jgi:hypothetical protein